MISFRVGYTDAEALQKEFGPNHIPQQFVDLEKFEVLVRLFEDGTNTTPFKGVTLEPLSNGGASGPKLEARSQGRFATDRALLEAKLRRAMAPSNYDHFPRK